MRRWIWLTFPLAANVNINYRLPIKVYYRMCTFRNIRIEINHGSQNVFFLALSFDFYHGLADISKFYPSLVARNKILIFANPYKTHSGFHDLFLFNSTTKYPWERERGGWGYLIPSVTYHCRFDCKCCNTETFLEY